MALVAHMTSRDHKTKLWSNIMGRILSFKVTVATVLVEIEWF